MDTDWESAWVLPRMTQNSYTKLFRSSILPLMSRLIPGSSPGTEGQVVSNMIGVGVHTESVSTTKETVKPSKMKPHTNNNMHERQVVSLLRRKQIQQNNLVQKNKSSDTDLKALVTKDQEYGTSPAKSSQCNLTDSRNMRTLSNKFQRMNMSTKTSILRQRSASANIHSGSRNRETLSSLEDIASFIASGRARQIIVVAGAGISTASGIPDFRTPGTGLYDNLQQYRIPYPEAIFDIDYFRANPRPFFALAKELFPAGKYRPNIAHYFSRLLHDKGLLLRMYTQNIDCLERLAGLPPEKLVEAHGTFVTATCTQCRRRFRGDVLKADIYAERVPKCRSPLGCTGVLKPDIVFFGEDLPSRFYFHIRDFAQADLLLIMGTSLKVEPFASIVDCTRFDVPRLLINLQAVGPFRAKRRVNDVVASGDLNETIDRMVDAMNWTEELKSLMGSCEGDGLKDPETLFEHLNASESGEIIRPERRCRELNGATTDGKRNYNNNNHSGVTTLGGANIRNNTRPPSSTNHKPTPPRRPLSTLPASNYHPQHRLPHIPTPKKPTNGAANARGPFAATLLTNVSPARRRLPETREQFSRSNYRRRLQRQMTPTSSTTSSSDDSDVSSDTSTDTSDTS